MGQHDRCAPPTVHPPAHPTPLAACLLRQVKVADRTVIVTTDAETRVAEPKGLQALIDEAVAAVPSGGWGWAPTCRPVKLGTCALGLGCRQLSGN